MVNVKIYRVEGQMLISHDRFPRIQKFVKDVRAVKPEDAIEIVYSELGSRHKVKRKHIKIFKVWYEDRKLLPGQRMKKKLIARIFWDYNGDSIIKTYDKEYHDKMKEFAEQHNFDYVVRCWEKV